jgi:hypothetical protein
LITAAGPPAAITETTPTGAKRVDSAELKPVRVNSVIQFGDVIIETAVRSRKRAGIAW